MGPSVISQSVRQPVGREAGAAAATDTGAAPGSVAPRRRVTDRFDPADPFDAAIARCDAGEVLVFANARWIDRFGRGQAEVLGRHLRDAVGEPAYALFAPHLRRTLGGQPEVFEAHLPLAGDGGTWVAGSFVPDEHDGRVLGAFLVMQDVTTRHRHAQALRESEERLRLAVETVGLGVWELDLDADVVTGNAELMAMMGLPWAPGEPMPRTALEQLMHPEDRDRMLAAWAAALADRSTLTMEYRARRADGGERWLLSMMRGRYDAAGRPLRLFGTVLDVTERKRLEAGAERERAGLLAALEREAELRARAQRAVQFSEMFVGILSHDLRNPLTSIKMAATMMERQAPPPGLLRPLARIQSATERMRRMIDQLLDFTSVRLGSGLPLSVDDADLSAVCAEAIDELDAERAQVDLGVQGDPRGRWDHDRLAQLASNLIGNACQHRQRGSRVRVLVDGEARDQVRLVVQNRGVIEPEIAANIFDPMRGGRRARGSSGLGLGLFISRAIAVAHHGSIAVDSQGNTVTFVVTLPRMT